MARIATITSGPPTGTGGTDRHLATLKQCFESDGHQVDCYHFEQLNPPRPWTFADRCGYRIPGHGRVLAGRVLAQDPPYDLIIANSFLGAHLPPSRIPVINVFHSCDAAYAKVCRPSLTYREYLRRRYVWSHFERRSARRHFVVAVSAAVERELWHYYGVRADRVITPAVDVAHFCPGSRQEARNVLGLPNDGVLLLFAGTWEYRKGADLVSALAAAVPAGCRVVAASPGTDLPVWDGIIMRRDIRPDRMVWAYRACDLFVFPTRAEAFGLVTAEAMACGIPVVTTTAGLGGDLQGHQSLAPFIIDCPPSIGALSRPVSALLSDSGLRHCTGMACREYAERHLGIDRFNAQFSELVTRLVGTRTPPPG